MSRRHPIRRTPLAGLSIVEGLVICLGLAAVLAIVLPLFARRTLPPVGSRCMYNLRQLTVELAESYILEHREHFPPATDWNHLLTDASQYDFNCRNTPHKGTMAEPDYLYLAGPKSSLLAGMAVEDVTQPTATILFAEQRADADFSKPYFDDSQGVSTQRLFQSIGMPHVDEKKRTATVAVFVDGHAELLTAAALRRKCALLAGMRKAGK